MKLRSVSLFALLVALLLAAASPAGPLVARLVGTPVVAPLADPSAVPGIGRCTSDGECTVTEDAGTRRAAPLRLAP
jgi:hypothetical protein